MEILKTNTFLLLGCFWRWIQHLFRGGNTMTRGMLNLSIFWVQPFKRNYKK